jgi:hypothetical protein
MPASCTVCSRPDRHAVDQALAVPVPNVASLAHRYGIAETTLRRHRVQCVNPALRAAAAEAEGVRAAGLLRRLFDMADDAARIRAEAERLNRPRTAVAALDSETKIVTSLVSQLGVTDETVVTQLEDLRRVVDAMAELIKRDTAAAELLAELLDEAGVPSAAAGMRSAIRKWADRQIAATAPATTTTTGS